MPFSRNPNFARKRWSSRDTSGCNPAPGALGVQQGGLSVAPGRALPCRQEEGGWCQERGSGGQSWCCFVPRHLSTSPSEIASPAHPRSRRGWACCPCCPNVKPRHRHYDLITVTWKAKCAAASCMHILWSLCCCPK